MYKKHFLSLLTKGLYVDFFYSVAIIIVIIGMFSTPFILGSIKNKMYSAIKLQGEKEDNAKELFIQLKDSQYEVDLSLLQTIKQDPLFQKLKVFESYSHIVMIKGLHGSRLLSLDTLVPDDPRSAFLQIKDKIPDDFGLFDIIVSDELGKILYGENWDGLWQGNNFIGTPLTIEVNDIVIKGSFRIVARQKGRGLKLYGSNQLGMNLKKYASGLGSQDLGLPTVESLVTHALPKFLTEQCSIIFSNDNCEQEQQTKIVERLKAGNFHVNKSVTTSNKSNQIEVTLTTPEINGEKTIFIPQKDDCEKRLAQYLTSCSDSVVVPKIDMSVDILSDMSSKQIHVVGATNHSVSFLNDFQLLRNSHGGNISFENNGFSEKGLELVVPYGLFKIGDKLPLQINKATKIPSIVAAYYRCDENPLTNCPIYMHAQALFRLKNVLDNKAIFKEESSSFYPSQIKIYFDKIMIYAEQIEDVKDMYMYLQKKFNNYNVRYNITAIDRLEKNDKRLSTLFQATMLLSVFFIILSIGALAKVNIDRRKRQMAQLFILGYSKIFVSMLILCEYLILTITASLTALFIGKGIFWGLRFLASSTMQDTLGDFQSFIIAMDVDMNAFILVFSLVMCCTLIVAIIASYQASKADPVTLLD